MAMADGISKRLDKIEFEIGERIFKFAINPENYVYKRPHRTTAIKTKSRIVIEDFQDDIPTIYIRGTTGFNPTGKAEDRGIAKIKEMKEYLERYTSMGGNGDTPAEDFYFHNYTNDEHFVVHISADGVTYTQDVQSPLTYKYEIMLTVLRKAGEPAEEDIVDPEIGNKYPSVPKTGGPYGPEIDPGPQSSPTPFTPLPDIYDTPSILSPPEKVYAANSPNMQPINPQAPSTTSYELGATGLGQMLGYYGRNYKI